MMPVQILMAIQYINDFGLKPAVTNNIEPRNIQVVKIFKPRNMGIAHSLKSCWSALYDLGIEYIMNIVLGYHHATGFYK